MILLLLFGAFILGLGFGAIVARSPKGDQVAAPEKINWPENISDRSCGYCGKEGPFPCWQQGVCIACAGQIANSLQGGVQVPWQS